MKMVFLHLPKKHYLNGRLRSYSIMAVPMGTFMLADQVSRKGVDVEIVHAGIEELRDSRFSLADDLSRARPDIVGIDLQWHPQLNVVLEAVRDVRSSLPESVIVLGGLTASYFCGEIMDREAGVDYIIRGDGETALLELLTCLAEGRGVEGVGNLGFRRQRAVVLTPIGHSAGRAEIDRLDFTNIGLLRHHEMYSGKEFCSADESGLATYLEKRRFHLFVGRGCAFDCAFCGGANHIQKRLNMRSRVVLRSVERIAEDVSRLAAKGISHFYVSFDVKSGLNGYFVRVFREIRRRGANVALDFDFYLNHVPDSTFIREFARTFDLESSAFAFSLRSADPPWLEPVLQACATEGISCKITSCFLPEFSLQTIREILRYTKELGDRYENVEAAFSTHLEIEPGSDWYERPERHGLQVLRRSFDDFLAYHRRDACDLGLEEQLGYRLRHPEAVHRFLEKAGRHVRIVS